MKSKKSVLKALENKADVLWSQAVRKRDGKCLICGSKDNLQAHHAIMRRVHKATRWDLRQGLTLCYRCHIHGIHGNQVDGEFHDKYIVARNIAIPYSVQEELKEKGHQNFKTDIGLMETIIAGLKEMI